MTDHDKKLLKRIGLIVGIIIAGIVMWRLYYTFFVFHATGVTPKATEISQYTPNVAFTFSQDVQADGLTAVMKPDLIGTALVEGNKVTVNFDPLTIGQTYTVTIKSIKNKKGNRLPDQSVTFTVKNVPYDKLPESQKQADIERQNAPNAASTQDKAFDYIPYSSIDYNLTISQTGDDITINAELLLSSADVRTGPEAAAEAYKQEVLDYLTKSGLDPAKYNIVYTVSQPTN